MKKIAYALSILIIGSLLGCGNVAKDVTPTPVAKVTASVPSPVPASVTQEWTMVKTWSGDSVKDTETFEVTENTRVNWETSDTKGMFQIYIQDKGATSVGSISNTKGVKKGVSYLHLAPGKYSLKISAERNTPWTVTVEKGITA